MAEPIYFDFAFLRRRSLLGLAMLVMAPFSRDPMVVIVCGFILVPGLPNPIDPRCRRSSSTICCGYGSKRHARLARSPRRRVAGDGLTDTTLSGVLVFNGVPCRLGNCFSNLSGRPSPALPKISQRTSTLAAYIAFLSLFGIGSAVFRARPAFTALSVSIAQPVLALGS